MNRCHFGRQPARLVLVDLSPPFDQDVCHNIQTALQQVLSLACGLNGPSRVPFFGLYALGGYPEALLPLQHTRGNYARLQGALHELQMTCNELAGVKVVSCVSQGLQEALAAFQRQSQGLLQTAGYYCQLEVTIFTCQQPLGISKHVEKVIRDITMEILKKVQIVCLSHGDRLRTLEDISASQTSDNSSHSSTSDITALAECTTIEADILSLESYMKSWLHDSGTDREHVHLVIQQDRGASVILKCDFHERVLNPASLPFPASYNLHPEVVVTKPVPSTGGKSLSQNVPVQTLRVIKKIPSEAICESINFGLPLIVRATSCWKMEWDELETNQLNFQALCHLLHNKKQVLLSRLQTEPPNNRTSGFRYQLTPAPPCGHFLLFASPNATDSLLVKPVATRELLLPGDTLHREAPSQDSLTRMESALDAIDESADYNPLTVSSNLYAALNTHLCKGKPAAANSGPNKRKFMSANVKGDAITNGRGFQSAATAVTDRRTDQAKQKRTKPNSNTMTSGKDFYSQLPSPFPTEL